jgi:hypothetical protein
MKKLYTTFLLSGILLLTSSMTTLKSEKSGTKTDFDINNYTWLAGHWTGDGFGGVSDEVWSLPANGTMMGVYSGWQSDFL